MLFDIEILGQAAGYAFVGLTFATGKWRACDFAAPGWRFWACLILWPPILILDSIFDMDAG